MGKIFSGRLIYWFLKKEGTLGSDFIWPRDVLSRETGLRVFICLRKIIVLRASV